MAIVEENYSVQQIYNDNSIENLNISLESCHISYDGSSKYSDSLSERTSASFDMDFEVLLQNDYSKVLDALTSECYKRSNNDMRVLSQVLQNIPDFMSMQSSELELVCQAAKLQMFSTDQLVIRKYSQFQEWYFCLDGSLRKQNNEVVILKVGDYVGADLISGDILISDFDLYSNSDDCKLLVIDVKDLRPGNEANSIIIRTHSDDKSVIAVYEACTHNCKSSDLSGYALTKCTPDELVYHVLSNHKWTHDDFIDDFFLTHELYMESLSEIMSEMITSLENDSYPIHTFHVFLKWLTQYYPLVETNQDYLQFVHRVITIFNQKYKDWLYLVYDHCSSSSETRYFKRKMKMFGITSVDINSKVLFYFDGKNDPENQFREGDTIINFDGYPQDYITLDMIKTTCNENRAVSITVKNDLLGYHELVLKDVSMDTCSINSTPSTSRYSRCLSEKNSDSLSLSTNESDSVCQLPTESTGTLKKRPSLLPNLLFTGTVGRFFKNPKTYSKGSLPNNHFLYDGQPDIEHNYFNRPYDSSTIIPRFSRRIKSKRRRRSTGSNPELMKNFDDRQTPDNEFPSSGNCPFRIYWKNAFIGYTDNQNTKSELRHIHFMINPSMTVTEVIVIALLKLELSSVSSSDFYLVEMKIDESNMMIHEKILKPTLSNLPDRMKNYSRFFLKHRTYVGSSLISQLEAEKMITQYQSLTLPNISKNFLIVRLFLHSHALLSGIRPEMILKHISKLKSTLKVKTSQIKDEFYRYMSLSDFYKCWVITEICSRSDSATKRVSIIQYFIHLAVKAIHIGHIDLFFSLLSGLDSIEVTRLHHTWDKVNNQEKKLLRNLRSILDVTGNMRNLRNIHQKMVSPFIPLTAMVVKDLTMIEETHSTFVNGLINGEQSNENLINFDKMRKMSRLIRTFLNSCCSCSDDKTRPVPKHLLDCKKRPENSDVLQNLLIQRLDTKSNSHPDMQNLNLNNYSSCESKTNRKSSTSSLSVKSSSSESMSELNSPVKCPDYAIQLAYERKREVLRAERFFSKLKDRVIIDPDNLYDMSLNCESGNQNDGIYGTKSRQSAKIHKTIDDQTFISPLPNGKEIPNKAAEMLGLKANSDDNS